jgi:hypothetical protein
MALTAKQRAKVIYYLGWSGLTIVADSTHYNSVVNDRLGANDTDAEIERLTKDLLTRLEKCDAQLEDAKCRLAAAKVDSITMNKDEIAGLKKERMRLIRELSDHLDIPIMKSSSQQVSIRV